MKEKKFKIDYLQALSQVNMVNSFNGLIWTGCSLFTKNPTHQLLGYGFTIMGICGIFVNAFFYLRDKKKDKAKLQDLDRTQTRTIDKAESQTTQSEPQINNEIQLMNWLDQIGRRCFEARKHTNQAVQDIIEINRLGQSIDKFEQIAAKKTLITQLKNQHAKVKEAILQNARDIILICTAGEVEAKGKLTDEDKCRIEREIESNENKLSMFKTLMKETGQAAIEYPEEEVFGNIDLESSIKVAQFYQSSRKAPF